LRLIRTIGSNGSIEAIAIGRGAAIGPHPDGSIGASPSGKAPAFDAGIRRFESCRPSHLWSQAADFRSVLNELYISARHWGAASNLFSFAGGGWRQFVAGFIQLAARTDLLCCVAAFLA
jgi:hypothetical protein